MKPLKRTPLKRKAYKPSKASLERRKEAISKFNLYVKTKIESWLDTHSQVSCLECSEKLKKGKPLSLNARLFICDQYVEGLGFHVAHIISGAEAKNLYYIRENSIFLCRHHHNVLDGLDGIGEREHMLILPELERRAEVIKKTYEELMKLPHNSVFY